MDSMVRMTMTMEREIDDARSIRDTGASDKRKEGQPYSSSVMSLKVIYFQSIFLIDFYIKRPIYMQESGINFTKLLCSRKFKRK